MKQRMPMKNDSTFFFFIKKIYFKSPCDNISLEEFENNDMAGIRDGFFPSEKIICKIIDFAYSYDVVDTRSAGQVEINLN